MSAYPFERSKQEEPVIIKLGEDLWAEELFDGNSIAATVHSSAFPSPVNVRMSPQWNGYYFSADWELPKPLRDNSFTNLRLIYRAARSHLNPEKLDKFKKADVRIDTRKENAPKRVPDHNYEPESYTKTAQGITSKEQFILSELGTRYVVEFTGDKLDEPFIAVREPQTVGYVFQGVIPQSLYGSWRHLEDARSAIIRYVDKHKS